ncbi:MAG TPA: M28 family peptidase [Bryobacteraceae bacterium]|nr:M28 family peptidase [Bryobacteraceae bacterium]
MKPLLARIVLIPLAAAGFAAAQDSPFVQPDVYRYLSGEISGDVAYDHIRHLTLYHSTSGASQGFRDKMRWIADKARQVGLQEIRIIENLPLRGPGWSVQSAELYETAPAYRRLAGFDDTAVMIADNSSPGEWTGELVDVGSGVSAKDYEGKDVKGRILLISSGALGAAAREGVEQRGALGIVSYNGDNLERPEQIAWSHLPAPSEGKPGTFGFALSNIAGSELRQRLARGEKITLQARVAATFDTDRPQWLMEGWIRGKRRDQAVVLTAHVQEEKYSANDDNSGCANLLEIARAYTKLIKEGKLPQPERDIRFWWVNEISGEYAYFSRHPEQRANMLVNLNQDMVGAKQSLGSRIQHITRTPWSRPSYLNDVVESIATMVMRGNTSYLSAVQSGRHRGNYSKPILSRTGTRERFGAEIVPYFSNTDHMVFVDSIIGIPAVTLTNWPDDYIHSSYDDLWNVDPTQLQRNAFLVAAAAWYFAALQPADVPILVGEVHAGAQKRLAADFARASSMLLSEPAGAKRARLYHDGVNLIERAAEREQTALQSTRVFGAKPDAGGIAVSAAAFKKALTQTYTLLTGSQPSAPEVTETEKKMAGHVPEVALGVADYIEKRGWGGGAGAGLHHLMAFEALNFVDGRRSYADIYKAVRAEAQSVGEWYYGEVELQAVADVLDAAVKKGMLKLK